MTSDPSPQLWLSSNNSLPLLREDLNTYVLFQGEFCKYSVGYSYSKRWPPFRAGTRSNKSSFLSSLIILPMPLPLSSYLSKIQLFSLVILRHQIVASICSYLRLMLIVSIHPVWSGWSGLFSALCSELGIIFYCFLEKLIPEVILLHEALKNRSCCNTNKMSFPILLLMPPSI